MKTKEDIEALFIELELPFERLEDGLWVVVDESDHIDNLVVYTTGTVLNLRVKVVDLPSEPTVPLLRALLELNATDLVHGAYAIENDAIVLVESLEMENLDNNELQAVVEAFGIALTTHYARITAFLQDDDTAAVAAD